mgnify:CR=1 FL=1
MVGDNPPQQRRAPLVRFVPLQRSLVSAALLPAATRWERSRFGVRRPYGFAPRPLVATLLPVVVRSSPPTGAGIAAVLLAGHSLNRHYGRGVPGLAVSELRRAWSKMNFDDAPGVDPPFAALLRPGGIQNHVPAQPTCRWPWRSCLEPFSFGVDWHVQITMRTSQRELRRSTPGHSLKASRTRRPVCRLGPLLPWAFGLFQVCGCFFLLRLATRRKHADAKTPGRPCG